MLLTKESDYGLRIMRALADGEKKTVRSICDQEKVPYKFAYKILKKLEKGNCVRSFQGPHGGYQLAADLGKVTLYDVVAAADDNIMIFPCVQNGNECPRNSKRVPCKVHIEFERIQNLLMEEMKRKSIKDILG